MATSAWCPICGRSIHARGQRVLSVRAAAYGAKPSPVVVANREALQKFETKSTKPEALTHLTNGFEYAKRTLAALDPSALVGTHQLFGANRTIVETSFAMTADLHEHLGQLIAYARVNHVTPPWSR